VVHGFGSGEDFGHVGIKSFRPFGLSRLSDFDAKVREYSLSLFNDLRCQQQFSRILQQVDYVVQEPPGGGAVD
jgi:hypothetical protein